jgi:hypothetical protein
VETLLLQPLNSESKIDLESSNAFLKLHESSRHWHIKKHFIMGQGDGKFSHNSELFFLGIRQPSALAPLFMLICSLAIGEKTNCGLECAV